MEAVKLFALYSVYFEAVNSASAGLIYESRQSEKADDIHERKWARAERLGERLGWTVIGTVDGACISFQDLITGEKNVARGEAWRGDKWREVVSVQISNGHIKGDMGERGRERERQRKTKR